MTKKAFFYLVTLLILVSSCAVKPTKLSVKFDNSKIERINLNVNGNKEILELDENGMFNYESVIENDTYATLALGGQTYDLYLKAGESLSIMFKSDHLSGTAEYGGTYTDIYKYLEKQNQKNISFYGLEEPEFLNKASELTKEKLEFLANSNLDENFCDIESERIKYDMYKAVLLYRRVHPMQSHKKYEPSENFKRYFSDVSFDNDEYLNLYSYRMFSILYVRWYTSLEMKTYDPTLHALAQLDYISTNSNSQKIINYLFHSIIVTYISRNGVEKANKIIEKFHNHTNNVEYLNEIEKLCSKWRKLIKGKQSPNFKMLDINGKYVSLTDLKGKYIYIDCWATWCGPCRGELPYLAKLEEEFKDKNIHFVSMSCDDDKSAWEKVVKDESLGGIQLYAGTDNKFLKDYMVNGIPHFILIDKEGKIISNNASRPSGSIKKTLNELEGF